MKKLTIAVLVVVALFALASAQTAVAKKPEKDGTVELVVSLGAGDSGLTNNLIQTVDKDGDGNPDACGTATMSDGKIRRQASFSDACFVHIEFDIDSDGVVDVTLIRIGRLSFQTDKKTGEPVSIRLLFVDDAGDKWITKFQDPVEIASFDGALPGLTLHVYASGVLLFKEQPARHKGGTQQIGPISIGDIVYSKA